MNKKIKITYDKILAGTFLYFTNENEITIDDLKIYIDRIKQDLYWKNVYFIFYNNYVKYLKNSKYFDLNDDIVSLKKDITKDMLKSDIIIDDELLDSMIAEFVVDSARDEIMRCRCLRRH